MEEIIQSSTQGSSKDWRYMITPRGILKVAQAVLSFFTFICVSAGSDRCWRDFGGGFFVIFVGIACCILTTEQIIFNVLMIYQRVTDMPYVLLGLVYYLSSAVCFVIAMLIAAVKADYDGVTAAAVFSAFCVVLYGVDFVLDFMAMRSGGRIQTGATTKKTTTTASGEPV